MEISHTPSFLFPACLFVFWAPLGRRMTLSEALCIAAHFLLKLNLRSWMVRTWREVWDMVLSDLGSELQSRLLNPAGRVNICSICHTESVSSLPSSVPISEVDLGLKMSMFSVVSSALFLFMKGRYCHAMTEPSFVQAKSKLVALLKTRSTMFVFPLTCGALSKSVSWLSMSITRR